MLRAIFLAMILCAVTTIAQAQSPIVTKPAEELPFKTVDQQPVFNGDLNTFLRDHLSYPDAARERGMQGKVYVQFIVSYEGWVKKAKVVQSSGSKELDAEALRVVNSMNGMKANTPSWRPGLVNGQAVSTYFTQPVGFSLK